MKTTSPGTKPCEGPRNHSRVLQGFRSLARHARGYSRTIGRAGLALAVGIGMLSGGPAEAQVSVLPANSTAYTPFVNAVSPAPGFAGLTAQQRSGIYALGVLVSWGSWTAAPNLIDADLTNSYQVPGLLAGREYRVTDNDIYPAGTFAGFQVVNSNIANLLGAATVRTYKAGVLVEERDANQLLSLLDSTTRYIGFEATAEFDAVELFVASTVSLGTTDVRFAALRNRYVAGPALVCNVPTRMNHPTYPMHVVPERTGVTGLIALGGVTTPDAVVTASTSDFASIDMTLVALGQGSISVRDQLTVHPVGTFAGFDIENSSLVGANLLGGLKITTFLNGVQRQQISQSNLASVSSSLLSGTGRQTIGFVASQTFNEVQISYDEALLNANLAGSIRVYNVVLQSFLPACISPVPTCNVPVMVTNPTYSVFVNGQRSGFGGLATVGSLNNTQNVIDSDANSSATIAFLANVAGSGSLSVKDQLRDYAAGTFAGFNISNSSLLNAGVINGFTINTYLDGTLKETKSGNSGLVAANTFLFTAGGTRQTIGFVTVQPFDEVQLVLSSTLTVNLGTTEVYGLTLQSLCAGTVACNGTFWLNLPDPLVPSSQGFPVTIDGFRTGNSGLVAVDGSVTNASNAISSSTTDFATIQVVAGLGGAQSLSVVDGVGTYPAGTIAGFAIRDTQSLIEATLLGAITVETYNNGAFVESSSGNTLLGLSALIPVIGTGSGNYNVGFQATAPFDEIRITVASIVGLLNRVEVFGAYVNTTASDATGPGALDCNDPPVLATPIPNRTGTDSQTITPFSVASNFTDPENDDIDFTITGLPTGLTYNGETGTISGTIASNASQTNGGVYTVTVVATDNNVNNATVQTTFTWTVTNPAPLAVNDTASVSEDNNATGNVITGPGTDSDPDGDTPLVVTQFTVAGVAGTFTPGQTAAIPGVGSLTIAAGGAYTFVPVANYNGVVPTATYTLSDGQGGTATATLIITVNAVNDGPVVGTPIANQSSNDGQAVTLATAGNFSDVDGPSLTYSASNLPPGLSINPATGVISGTIASNASVSSPYGSSVTVSDGTLTATSPFTWTVANPAPVAVNDTANVAQGVNATGNVITGSGTDVDPDGDTLVVTQFTVAGVVGTFTPGQTANIPSVGTLVINANGTYTFTPLPAFTGAVPVATYAISDGQGGTASATLSILVNSDADGDGIPNVSDLDDDNDGIPDTVEAASAINGGDTDGDGIIDSLDLDSDNDGIPDFAEARKLTPAQLTSLDANDDGRLEGAVGTDGIPDVVQASANAGVVNYTRLDTDGDGHPDFQDLDSDNDGINDVIEAGGTDANGNGLADGAVGTTGFPSTVPAGGLTPRDSDGDSTADFRDLDSDNDGVNDVIENGGADADNNGIVGSGATPTDTDGDGIADAADGTPAAFGDSGPAFRDSDGDGVADYRDLDSDNDGINDVVENGISDPDGNGIVGSGATPVDADGDGIVDVVDGTPAAFGDSASPAPRDTDGDGVADYRDLDSDNDGINDVVENGGSDPDNNGIIGSGAVPTDTDGDGIADVVDGTPAAFGDSASPALRDTDGDSVPDYRDLDSDNDGINDVSENGGADPDNNGLVGTGAVPVDTDGDGIADAADGLPAAFGDSGPAALDTDGDGVANNRDLDSDNDGINDVIESGSADPDNNGIVGSGAIPTDTDGDGIADVVDGTPAAFGDSGGTAPRDTDGDTVPDFGDLDSDNDGINDVVETGGSDPDNNGIVGTGAIPVDTDGDGIVDVADGTPAAFGDSGSPAPVDSDGDGVPNYRDLDSDNDSIPDVVEGGNGAADTNGDGTISLNESPDPDGDGIVNAVDGAPAVFGDAGSPAPLDTDGDTTPNYIDTDSNGDGTPDIVENGYGGLDGNNDGRIDNTTDVDGDGIPDNVDTSVGNFGGAPDPLDTDGDGFPNIDDLDDDNDGIPDTVETATATNGGDTDGDGVRDYLDLDSDNDGIPDFTEARKLTPAQLTALDADNDGRLDGAVGTDGIPDVVQASANAGTVNYTVLDSDGDSRPDFQDLDSDNDGLDDVMEAGGADTDNNGLADGIADANGVPASVPAGGLTPVDADGDGVANFRDLDSDNDGINDVVENGGSDTDNNGIVGTGAIPTDTDSDGIADVVDGTPAAFGDSASPAPRDTDGDGVPDFRDLDSDNDGINDVIENGGADPDNNGIVGSGAVPVDTDGDGIADGVDGTPAVFGDSASPAPLDSDGDGVPNYRDLDSDNDGINDVIENGGADPDNNGIVGTGAVPVDADADGIADVVDGTPAAFGDSGSALRDTDGDGVPDFRDLDSDNDGINDVIENGGGDPDNNGIVGSGAVPVDTDGDGIADVVDGTPAAFGDTGSPAPADSDGDGVPNYRDLDSDNDSNPDVVESGNGAADTNGDGTISLIESPDPDGDGIVNAVDGAPAVFGDAGSPAQPDADGDSTPNYLDTDSDGDGILDIEENGYGDLDANNDGRIDNITDVDGDGIPDNVDTNVGVFGGAPEPLDTDGDGFPNINDLDDDNDGIPDTVEELTAINSGDTDGDGIPDLLDLDSDNDGIPDFAEARKLTPAQLTALDADNDGRLDGTVGTDGIPDVVQASADAGTINYTILDTDGDFHPDFQDLDSDNDGTNDVVEAGGTDGDNDGLADGLPDANGVPAGAPAGGLTPVDTDGDSVADFRDLDSDNDGINDVIENGSGDPDNNGIVGTGAIPSDTDGDGIANVVDGIPAVFGDSASPAPRDTDGDGVPNFRDLDSDNDGINDVIENGGADPDNNGIVGTGAIPADTDGDGIADAADGIPAAFGDQGVAAVDSDGDGIPNYLDLDSDNDGINDVVENGGADPDNNGIVGSGAVPTDTDGDGIADVVDGTPAAFGDSGSPAPRDTDGDSIPDFRDLDSDNDGINDVIENGGADPDNNGIVGSGAVPADADGDGIADVVDGSPAIFGDSGSPAPVDSDGDGVPNYRDLDSDNDTIPDVVEGGNGAADTDGDGTINPAESPDADGDGIADVVDGLPNQFGDAGSPAPVDTDGDLIPDYLDTDSDGDGIPDIVENGYGNLDTNNDGQIDNIADADGDGIPDIVDTNDTLFGGAPEPLDSDDDGIPDRIDIDDDNDGIPDTEETANAINSGDTDGDGIPDVLDLDSDNDGIFDVVEAGHAAVDADKSGRADGPYGANGLHNAIENNDTAAATVTYAVNTADTTSPLDTDGDGRPDYLDLDSDNDTISDLLESGNGALIDLDHNGVVDGAVGATGLKTGAGVTDAVNSDADALPDYRDLNSDGTGPFDIVDNGYSALDANNDGTIDNQGDASDNDGIADVLDSQLGVFGGFPLTGCAAWNDDFPTDTDGDVFPLAQEYAFGASTSLGDHLVAGTTRRAGLSLDKNGTGGIDVSVVRPRGRYDVTYTLVAASSITQPTWTELAIEPVVTANSDGTDTLTWTNIQANAPLTNASGYVRLKVTTPCTPAGSHTLVQGYFRETISGTRQTYGVPLVSKPVFTGVITSASGSTLSLATSAAGVNLQSYLPATDSYYVEVTDGAAEGHRIEVDRAASGQATLALNLASANNTTATLPAGLAGSHFVIRRHRTLGEIFPNAEWASAVSVGSADRVELYSGSGYNVYYNHFSATNPRWLLQGNVALGSQNPLPLPPGVGMFVVHASSSGSNSILQTGDVRYNDFIRPLALAATGANMTTLGFPVDASPASLVMTVANGFVGAATPGSASQIQILIADTTLNATGYDVNYMSTNSVWRLQGPLINTTSVPLFKYGRSSFVVVKAAKPNWTHAMPWNPEPWAQP